MVVVHPIGTFQQDRDTIAADSLDGYCIAWGIGDRGLGLFIGKSSSGVRVKGFSNRSACIIITERLNLIECVRSYTGNSIMGQPVGGNQYELFCQGCNIKLLSNEPLGKCPRCGWDLHSAAVDPLAQTLLLKFELTHSGDKPPAVSALTEPSELDRLIGETLDVYRFESLLGRGSMGRVYLASHCELQRRCAVKVISPKLLSEDDEFVVQFFEEGRAAASLVHPNVVTIHAIGHSEGLHFLEMEYVPGLSLQQKVEEFGLPTPIRATAVAAQIAQGLAAAHRRGVIHRDLKPDNVMLDHRGIPKIADFGLARRVPTGSLADAKHPLAGTPHFMAPELFSGEPASPRTDVYALGVCYYWLLTGELPFRGKSLQELMTSVCTDPIPSIRKKCPDVSLEFAECISLLLAKHEANRPGDGIEASQLLQAVLGEMRDLESLLLEALGDLPDVRWHKVDQRYAVDVTLPDGRQQKLVVESANDTHHGKLLLIYSLCCPADKNYYETALRLNSEIPHGGVAIRNFDGRPMFIVVDTYPRGTVDGEEIRRSVLEVAYRADMVEKSLTECDTY